jgi:hypothetical protein
MRDKAELRKGFGSAVLILRSIARRPIMVENQQLQRDACGRFA